MQETDSLSNRAFEVVITPCIVTRQFDRCIRVALGKVRVDDEKEAVIVGAFSRDGLKQLMNDLESMPDPIGLPTPDEIKGSAQYMWAVVLSNGTSRQQYLSDQTETPFADLHLPEVEEFWLIPRFEPNALPWYGLIQGVGFVRRQGIDGELEPLSLPHPGHEPWAWQYYRNVTLHFGVCAGQTEVLPPHIVQVMGWRIGEVIFEIGVEEDGNYQVYRIVPKEHARFVLFDQGELELPSLPVKTCLQLVE